MMVTRRKFLMTSVTTFGAVVLCNFSLLSNTGKAVVSSTSMETTKEIAMPHVIVKLWPGRSEQQKIDLAKAIVRDVVDILGNGEESVSVAIEEVESSDWKEKVYKPDILNKPESLYKKPGYSM